MHYWGDDWFKENGDDFYRAISYCIDFWRKWGRIGTHGKEKYGTFRDHPYFWRGGLHDLIWPGHVWVRNRFIEYKLDRYIIKPFTRYTGIHWLGFWYQRQIYNYAIQKMCKKYPNIVDELVCDLHAAVYVKPGIFGKIDGQKIRDKYWQ